MKILTTIAIILFSSLLLSGQELQWSKHIGQNPNPDTHEPIEEMKISSIKTTKLGNIYVFGHFVSNFTFNDITYQGATTNRFDIFLLKLDNEGNTLWARVFAGSNHDLAENMCVDSIGNVYFTSRFIGDIDFGNGHHLIADGTQYDAAIVKISPTGSTIWAKNIIHGTSHNERIDGITLNKNEDKLFITGFSRSTQFNVGDTVYVNSDGGSTADLCYACLTTNGDYIWSKHVPSSHNVSIFRSIACDEFDNLYIGGELRNSSKIEDIQYTSRGYADMILLKANSSNGNIYWVAQGGATGDDLINSITTNNNFIYTIGYVSGIGTIDSIATSATQSSSYNVSRQMLLTKYNSEGRLIWKKLLGTNSYGNDLNIQENILVAVGKFSGTMDFNLNSITSNGAYDAAYFVFDTEGNNVAAQSIHGYGSYNDEGQRVFLNKDYSVIMGGAFLSDSIKIGENTYQNSSASFLDLFLAKYANHFVTTFTNKKNITCYGGNDGELTITPYFGHAPYTYEWKKDGLVFSSSDSALTNLSAGVYEVTVIDGQNESITNSYTLTQPNDITAVLSPTDNICFGGTSGEISFASLTGGNGGYSYFWTTVDGEINNATSATQTGLKSGTYTVTVTDKEGCEKPFTQIINQGDEIIITGTASNIKNEGSNGSIDINVSGGVGPYNYNWIYNNIELYSIEDISGLSDAGEYTVTVTDANLCSNNASFIVANENFLYGFLQSKTDVKCRGGSSGSIKLAYVGAQEKTVSISWKKNGINYEASTLEITNLTAGTYEATLSAEGEENSIVSVTIIEPSNEVTGTLDATDVTCFNGSNGQLRLVPSGGVAPYTYEWTSSNFSETRTTQNINKLRNGNYSVIITDKNGCKSSTINTTIDQPDAIDFSFNAVSPRCFGFSDGSLEVKDITGGNGNYTYQWSNTLTTPKIENLKKNTYYLTVYDGNRCYAQKRVSLEQPQNLYAGFININKTSCPEKEDGSINLSTTGGTGAYTCIWKDSVGNVIGDSSPSIRNLGVGTYHVILMDENNCSTTKTATITSYNPTPNPTLSCSDIISCEGSEITFTGSGPNANSFEFYVNGVVARTFSPTNTYRSSSLNNNDEIGMRVKSTAGCEATSSSLTITRNSLPDVTINASDDSICIGNPVTLSGNGATTYTWDNGITDNTAFNPTSTKTYTVIGTDANNCSSTAQQNVVVNQLPSANINTSSPTIWCEGANISTIISAVSAADSYQWIKDGIDITDSTRRYFVATEAGEYKVRVTKNNCSAESVEPITVIVKPAPTVNIVNELISVCQGESVTLSATGDAISYIWNNGITNGESFTPTQSQTYTVIGTGSNSCTLSKNVQVVVKSLPTGTIATTDPTAWCENDDIDFNLTVNNSTATLQWYKNGIIIDGETSSQYNGSTIGEYSVAMMDNGCSATSNAITISINERPSVSAFASQLSICSGDSVLLHGLGADSYSWDNGVTDSVFFAPSATATYSVVGTDAFGCSSSAQISITVNELPSVSAFASQLSICSGDSVLLHGLGANSYSWDNGVTDSVYFAPSATATYSVVGTDAFGCSSSAQVSITVNELPSVSAFASQLSICSGDSVLLHGLGADSYSWGNGVTDSVYFAPTATATYSVVGTDAFGCSDTAQIDIIVNELPSTAISTTQDVWCSNDSINFTLSTETADEYQWYINGVQIEGATEQNHIDSIAGQFFATLVLNGCVANTDSVEIIINQAPSIGTIASDTIVYEGDSIVLAGTGADNYVWNNNATDGIGFIIDSTQTFTVIGTDINGCSGTAEIEIIARPRIIANIITHDSLFWCQNDDIMVRLSLDTIANSYQWYRNGSPIANATDSTYIATQSGEYNTMLTINNKNFFSNTIVITVYELPTIAILASDTSVCFGEPITLTAEGATDYTWSNSIFNGTAFIPENTSLFTVTGTDINGCSDTSSIMIHVNQVNVQINTTDPTTWCSGSDISVNLSTDETDETNEYQWFLNNVLIDGATTQNYLATESGLYSLILSNGECSSIDSIEIVQIENPSIEISTEDTTEWCVGNASIVTLSAFPTNAQSYQWMKNGENIALANGVTHSTNEFGDYTLYVEFGGEGCSATSDTITITEYPLPSVDLPNDTIRIGFTSYTLDAGTGELYLWNSNFAIDDSTSQTIEISGNINNIGIYNFHVIVTNEYGCSASDSATVEIYDGTSIISESRWETNIYPNPTTNSFMLSIDGMEGDNCFIQIYNPTGVLVQKRTITVEGNILNEQFNLYNEAKGVYLIVIQNNGKVQTSKVILY